jgi:hypothetical protein
MQFALPSAMSSDTTALSLAGKAMVVAEKRSTRSALQVPFPHRLNTPYKIIFAYV